MELRFGLIGCGNFAALRATALRRAGVGRLLAVAGRSPQRVGDFARRYRAQAESSWERLIARPDLDVILVATPPDAHRQPAAAALLAGKHVLCEKPLTPTAEESADLVRIAAETGRTLGTGFNYRFYPSMVRARNLFQEGAVGQLRQIRAYAGYSAQDFEHEWMRDAAVLGGGCLQDNGIHLLDLCRWFLGEVTTVQGQVREDTWNMAGAEDNAVAVLQGVAGQVGHFHASWTERGRYEFALELQGQRGRIGASCFPMRTELLSLSEAGGPERQRTDRFVGTFFMEHLRSYRWVVIQSLVAELRDFARGLEHGRRDGASGTDGLRALQVAAAIRRSSTSGLKEPVQ